MMFSYIKEYWILVRLHIASTLVFLVGISSISLLSFIILFSNHSNYIEQQLERNILEYNEINREQLCFISNCKLIISESLNKSFRPNYKGILYSESIVNKKLFNLYNNLYINSSFELGIVNKTSNELYILNTNEIMNDFKNLMLLFIPLSLIIFTIPLVLSVKKEKEETIFRVAGNEALLVNKSMISIAENIHHELNTPLEVIDNKLEKIRDEFYLYIKNNSTVKASFIKSMKEDFDFIKTSSEQIYSVLEKMKDFKHLRYSNGNKNLKDIVEGSFKMIKISNTNFNYTISPELEEYKLKSSNIRNADILGVLLNHIKNSLEANSSEIIIYFKSFNKNEITIRFIDNGEGIPKALQNKIFKPNFSTKKTDIEVRGNGMYLNKYILESSGGKLRLLESSNKGTTLELIIPAEEI